ncbi:hypothetical protein SPRG_07721 [Saprolegnia parasitica CBS 223.65]|uniref:RNA methyltransferase n=1 Tax=Saprolegnia parasitica (strain CBS 223.65) TaxID=695850 RepID=A0A067C8A3_SAPPC|nr:hypothetical protein SPRG_07721 [Saprolegnia parasitica CBS 223.65]KDO27009.1 hypothetical protein SPRG_07721 [Saprolegnia parasitica CBS 223.65]|eukprot:XP_012202386.1 hypothetical protein SPRG_07721 [Saprolegnia parasitica CBS 223.65]
MLCAYYAFRWGNGAIEGKLEEDSRLAIFQREWFEGKKALDIGCNSGDFTLEVARRFAPAFIMGIDCDADLITQARTTLKEYISKLAVTEAFREVQKDHGRKDEHHRDDADNDDDEELPLSFRLWKPPASTQPSVDPLPNIGSFASGVRFPYNVVFKRENIATDVHTGKDYDVITCLSVTKWIHLYHGDAGIQQLFHLAYALLLPGGYFILEPQKWKSYHNRRDTNETTRAHYDSIALRPSAFSTYLLETVGFRSMTLLKVCSTSAHGFRRPVYLYQK